MNKPTKQQILDETDEQKLAEWVAVFCMGWNWKDGDEFFDTGWYDSDCKYVHYRDKYNPCQDKAQAFDLMVKYKINVSPITDGSNMWHAWGANGEDLYAKKLQIAIVKASLLSVIGD